MLDHLRRPAWTLSAKAEDSPDAAARCVAHGAVLPIDHDVEPGRFEQCPAEPWMDTLERFDGDGYYPIYRVPRDSDIPPQLEETRAAAKLYNTLAETEPVGGLFHSTC